ncbi:hypothetical protein GYMLUDRAFT_36397 [Collybiopsis luxurians FD-317 M1]|nr:hypothetical protein GYMLUDRAFT_36397 [Collybiopsis luxurians FD-317 M1]
MFNFADLVPSDSDLPGRDPSLSHYRWHANIPGFHAPVPGLPEHDAFTICSNHVSEMYAQCPVATSNSMGVGNLGVSSLDNAIGTPCPSYTPQAYNFPVNSDNVTSKQVNYDPSSFVVSSTPITRAVAGHSSSAEIKNQQSATENVPPATFKQGGSMRRTKEAKYICELCNRGLTTKQRLDSHIQSIHLNNSKTHKCRYCLRKLTGGRSLKRHQLNKNACPNSPLANR